MDESPYRKNARELDTYCIDCGKPPHGDEKRCIVCTVSGRKSRMANFNLLGVVVLALIGWAGLTAFGTMSGYLIDVSDGEITNGSAVAGGACFVMGAVAFGFIIVVLAMRWMDATSPKDR